jgi:hypothetical protein
VNRLALPLVVLVAFSVLTAYTVEVHGYLGVFAALGENPATRLAFVDLCLSLGLVLLWMRGDAQERGLPFWPYAAVIVAFGVAGALAYLIHRELRERSRVVPQRA